MSGTIVTPFLMFQGGRAEEAMNVYTGLLPGSRVLEATRYGPGEQGAEGTIKLARFEVGGQAVMCIDSPVPHAFDFTPSFSFFVDFDEERELRRVTDALLDGGTALMPLGDYGFSRQFAWVNDRFGVFWQLNLP